jgi:ubiquitin-activating enzyme E1
LLDPGTRILASIANDPEPLITVVDDERVELQDGELVTFTEVRGMTAGASTCPLVRST